MRCDYPQLPFPRGTTYSQGAFTPTATDGLQIEGQVYTVWDDDFDMPVKLRVVRNMTGSTLTLTAGKLIGFKDASGTFANLGNHAYSFALAADGDPAKPIDGAYAATATAAAYDLFYVVEEGPCVVLKIAASSTQAITAGAKVYGDSQTSKVDATVSSGAAVGRAMKDAASTADSVDVYVFPGFIG